MLRHHYYVQRERAWRLLIAFRFYKYTGSVIGHCEMSSTYIHTLLLPPQRGFSGTMNSKESRTVKSWKTWQRRNLNSTLSHVPMNFRFLSSFMLAPALDEKHIRQTTIANID